LITEDQSNNLHEGVIGGVRVDHLFLVFLLSCYVFVRSEFRVVMSVTISA